MASSQTLSAVDYIVLVILLLSSTVIGVVFGFFKSKRNSATEFLLGKDWFPFIIKQYR
jgi:hypothetical protein